MKNDDLREADVQAHANGVAEQIRKFNDLAARLGGASEVAFKPGMDLEPFTEREMKSAHEGFSLSNIISALAHTSRYVSLEKLNDKWGLYYALTTAERRSDSKASLVRLQDAPLELRERFLLRADDFFERYDALVQEATERRAGRIARMDETRKTGEQALSKWEARIVPRPSK